MSENNTSVFGHFYISLLPVFRYTSLIPSQYTQTAVVLLFQGFPASQAVQELP